MTALQVIGAGIIAAPFIALFAHVARTDGVGVALAMFAGTGLFLALIYLGSALLTGELA